MEQYRRLELGDTQLLNPKWRRAIQCDSIRTTGYGNNNEWEDMAEFALLHCLYMLRNDLSTLQAQSTERFGLWSETLCLVENDYTTNPTSTPCLDVKSTGKPSESPNNAPTPQPVFTCSSEYNFIGGTAYSSDQVCGSVDNILAECQEKCKKIGCTAFFYQEHSNNLGCNKAPNGGYQICGYTTEENFNPEYHVHSDGRVCIFNKPPTLTPTSTASPMFAPSTSPTASITSAPSTIPTVSPTATTSSVPSTNPTVPPTASPTFASSSRPTVSTSTPQPVFTCSSEYNFISGAAYSSDQVCGSVDSVLTQCQEKCKEIGCTAFFYQEHPNNLGCDNAPNGGYQICGYTTEDDFYSVYHVHTDGRVCIFNKPSTSAPTSTASLTFTPSTSPPTSMTISPSSELSDSFTVSPSSEPSDSFTVSPSSEPSHSPTASPSSATTSPTISTTPAPTTLPTASSVSPPTNFPKKDKREFSRKE